MRLVKNNTNYKMKNFQLTNLYASCRIRTCGPLLRRQLLYPAELRKHSTIISDRYGSNNNNNFFQDILAKEKFRKLIVSIKCIIEYKKNCFYFGKKTFGKGKRRNY